MCSRDRPALLRVALGAVAGSVRPGDEVIVVDSASEDPATGAVGTEAGARVLRCERPGASRARNAGWTAATHPIVAFTDDDCRPAPGWTAALAAAFLDPEVGFVFGRVSAGGSGVPMSLLDRAEPASIDPADPHPIGSANNLAVRAEALADVGGFDEVLGAGAPLRASEDKDLAWRLLRAGWRGVYVPGAAVVHDPGRGALAALRTFYSYGIGEGAFEVKQAAIHAGAPEQLPLPLDVGWQASLRQAGAHLRERYELGVALDLARAAGAVVGRRRARPLRLVGGRFRDAS